jgi:hypothetical protein
MAGTARLVTVMMNQRAGGAVQTPSELAKATGEGALALDQLLPDWTAESAPGRGPT